MTINDLIFLGIKSGVSALTKTDGAFFGQPNWAEVLVAAL